MPELDSTSEKPRRIIRYRPPTARPASLPVMRGLGERYQLRMECELSHVPALAWRSIADREALASWLRAEIEWEWRVGGRILLSFHADRAPHGLITAIDDDHTLAFTWGDSLVRFEVTEWGAGSRLSVTHTLAGRDPAHVAADWQIRLESLAADINGWPPPHSARWHELHSTLAASWPRPVTAR